SGRYLLRRPCRCSGDDRRYSWGGLVLPSLCPEGGMNAGRPLSIVLLMFGMLWIVVMLMQDFDLAGGKKAIMLLGLAVATVAVTLAVEGRALSVRSSTVLLAGLGIVLAAFAVL